MAGVPTHAVTHSGVALRAQRRPGQQQWGSVMDPLRSRRGAGRGCTGPLPQPRTSQWPPRAGGGWFSRSKEPHCHRARKGSWQRGSKARGSSQSAEWRAHSAAADLYTAAALPRCWLCALGSVVRAGGGAAWLAASFIPDIASGLARQAAGSYNMQSSACVGSCRSDRCWT